MGGRRRGKRREGAGKEEAGAYFTAGFAAAAAQGHRALPGASCGGSWRKLVLLAPGVGMSGFCQV